MFNWRPIPFVRLLLPLVLGIVVQETLQWKTGIGGIAGTLAVLLLLSSLYAFRRTARKHRWIFGLLSNFVLISVGILLHFFYQENNSPEHFSPFANQECSFSATVMELTPKGDNFHMVLKVNHMGQDTLFPTNGRLLAYLPQDSNSLQLDIGHQIQVRSFLSKASGPLNPKGFDFAKYLHTQNIHYRTFIRGDRWQKIPGASTFSVLKMAHNLQKKCLSILKKHLHTDQELAVASALILGYKPGLDEEVKSAYADTGAMHVLAVSGLHTGFIFLLAQWLLQKIPFRNKTWKIIKTVLLVLCLWGFALITGASPSVLRSATMFSFIAVGQAINRESSIYNTLAASAFCLLLTNPFLLFSPGFQLSYLAVAGIVYFQPLIYKLVYLKNKLLDYLWKLFGVSCAAQLSTFPLSLYYFHKVPLYFWLSGMIVVPAAALILPVGLMLFAFDKVPFLGWLIGKLLYFAVGTMNFLIFHLQELPGTLWSDVWIGTFAFLLIALAISGVIFIIETKQVRWIFATLLCLLTLCGWNITREWETKHQKEVVIYHQKGQILIDLFDGTNRYTFSTALPEDKGISFSAENYRQFKKAKTSGFFPLDTALIKGDHFRYQNGYFQFYDMHFFVLNKYSTLPSPTTQIDFLLIAQNRKLSPEALEQAFNTKSIILDGSNSRNTAVYWADLCIEKGIKFHYTFETGAFIYPQ